MNIRTLIVFAGLAGSFALPFAGCKPREFAGTPAGTAGSKNGGEAMAKMAAAEARMAPAWNLKGTDGKPVSSGDFKGKVVVVDFWATWCPPCVAEIPGYVKLQEKYAKDGLVIVGISLDEGGVDLVKKFAASKKINYPLAMGDGAVVEAFGGVEAIPTTFVIDREGRIQHKKVGAVKEEEFESVLKKFL